MYILTFEKEKDYMTDYMWLAKLKYLLLGPLQKKFAGPWCQSLERKVVQYLSDWLVTFWRNESKDVNERTQCPLAENIICPFPKIADYDDYNKYTQIGGQGTFPLKKKQTYKYQ